MILKFELMFRINLYQEYYGHTYILRLNYEDA